MDEQTTSQQQNIEDNNPASEKPIALGLAFINGETIYLRIYNDVAFAEFTQYPYFQIV
jgi:hypothetical protein